MAGRDDSYRDDPYGDSRDGSDDDARPGARRATRPARPAWDAMTYGVPSDSRRPVEPAPPPYEPPPPGYEPPPPAYEPPPVYEPPSAYEPSRSGYEAPPRYEPPPTYSSAYGAEPAAPTYGSSYGAEPAAPSAYPGSYPGGADPYPAAASSYPATASTYPAADSYAPAAPTSYRAPSGSPPAVDEEPVYVASGLYADETGSATSVEPPAPAPPGKGRSLPAFGARAVVGLILGAVVLGSLLFWRPAFLGLVAVAVGIGVWELVRAVQGTGANPPLIPLVAGSVLMTGLAWWGGIVGLTFGLAITVVATMAWRFTYGVAGYGRDVTAATLVAVYVPFLAGFAALLGSAPDGDRRVLATLIAVVLSDTGGYVVGALFGRHPMAPSVSPKKSWEGFGGSLLAASVGSAIVVSLMFDASIVAGLLFGLGVAVASVIGDLGESLLKRDLGVKDMSALLPGHGGLMDRLDSILFAAPAAYLMFAVIAPV